MARSPKKGNSGPTETVATVLILPPDSKIVSLAKKRRSAKKQAGEITGEYANAVAQSVEKDHVDRKALGIAVQLNDMSDEKLHVTYFHLLKYIEALGIDKRATSQEEMFAQHGGNAGSQESDPDTETGDTGNVRRIGTTARRVAEAAGAD